MTCKDCLSYEACRFYNKNLPEEYEPIELQCDNFKDKSQYIKLPCKAEVGQTVYVILCGNDNIYKISKMGIKIIKPFGSVDCIITNNDEIKDSGIKTPFVWNIFLIDTHFCYYKFNFSDIGTKIFLDKKEAEEKLKELNNNSIKDVVL